MSLNTFSQITVRDLLFTLFWLLGVLFLNQQDPIAFIGPYALPVIVLTWKYNISIGLVVAASAVLIAVWGGSIPSNEQLEGYLIHEGLFAFYKLSIISLGTMLVKWVYLRLST